ncbi:MAG: hypothetical protein A2Z21_08710 [Candidatus Fraserbacteria bacterium RBG_16_55_9]|uniref:TRAM domain-containing protein n=1 Tax=Fraserbacteria sp. (strain RBG_16_55_9) TaxID=1817864 RepID=A0A1F5V0B1_FRAXR|nr:MAG: hypothetical protein A2Z21_08710 [Candidatus Fraserbacteria bacterium RBG_16_55_9]
MLRNVFWKILFYLGMTSLGALVTAGQGVVSWRLDGQWVHPLWLNLLVGALGGALSAGLMHGISSFIVQKVAAGEEVALLNGSLVGLVGALFGLLGYAILELLFNPGVWLQLTQAGLVFFLTFLGFRVGYSKENLFLTLISGEQPSGLRESPKLIDTSVIIDGRIGDLVKTGFIEDGILIPQFVLDELHGIADSSDSLRRRKGRRGLDILGELRQHPGIHAEIFNRDYPEIHGVDRKLIQLAKELGAKIITTDFNLNKVAKVEGIQVLNINELANAIKPRFIPGEELEVEVIDRGEEIGQGVGYLDDGTMVVVENGRRFIGKKIRAVVSSSLQTDAGKMLFVRPKSEADGRGEE